MNLKSYYLVCLLALFGSIFESKSQAWTDISTAWINSQGMDQGTTSYNIGCGGVVVNRLTGDAVINFTRFGLWRTSDQGKTYVRIDQNTVGGGECRCASAWAIQCDQDDPKRMAMFSLDGTSAYTTDGVNWKQWTNMARGWDVGAVNWDAPDPKVIFAAQHENNSILALSIDGGTTWKELDIKVDMQWSGASGKMLGVIDAETFIYSNNNGINRSTDQGETWTNVVPASTVTTRNRVAVMFKGVCYVGTTKGLLVSKDKGATWQSQGSSIDILQGPKFGEDENTMVIVNTNGMYKSTDAGATWKLLSSLTPVTVWSQYPINDVAWFANYEWDPVNNFCYSAAISHPAFKKELGPIDIIPPTAPTDVIATNITSTGFTVTWKASTDNVGVVGYEVFRGEESCGTTATTSLKVTGLAAEATYAITVKAKDAEGNISTASDVLNVTTLPDTPSIPENLQASEITGTSFKLSWSPSTGNVEVTGYDVYKDGEEYNFTEDTYMTISELTPETLYTMKVRAVDAAGNQSDFSAELPVNTGTIGIDNIAANEIIIYPNPGSDYILIEIPGNIFGSIIIYDASGVIVAEKIIQTNNIKMDVSTFPKGFYLAKITSGHKCMTKSFIIQ